MIACEKAKAGINIFSLAVSYQWNKVLNESILDLITYLTLVNLVGREISGKFLNIFIRIQMQNSKSPFIIFS